MTNLASHFPSPTDITVTGPPEDCKILPDFGALYTLFKNLATQALWAAVQGFIDLYVQIHTLFCLVFNALDALFPISASPPTLGERLRALEVEIEYKIRALIKEFKIFFMVKIFEMIDDLIGGILEPILSIPLPILSLLPAGDCSNLQIRHLLTVEGRSQIKQCIIDNYEAVKALIPTPFKNMLDGTFNFKSFAMEVVEFFQNIIISAIQAMFQPLVDAFKSLISAFQEIWDLLGLPSIPEFTPSPWTPVTAYIEGDKVESSAEDHFVCIVGGTSGGSAPTWNITVGATTIDNTVTWERVTNTDIWSGIKSIIDGIITDVTNTIEDMIEAIGDIEIPIPPPLGPITVRELLNLPLEDTSNVKIAAQRLATMIQSAFLAAIMYPLIVLELWIEEIKSFLLSLINPLPIPIPFTFCDFLGLVLPGYPPEIPTIPAIPSGSSQIPPIPYDCS